MAWKMKLWKYNDMKVMERRKKSFLFWTWYTPKSSVCCSKSQKNEDFRKSFFFQELGSILDQQSGLIA